MNSNHVTIGIDLGDRKHSACVLSAGGEILAETEITNTRECLTAFARRYPGAVIVLETGTHSPWVSRLLAGLGHTVHVANARKLRAISTAIWRRPAQVSFRPKQQRLLDDKRSIFDRCLESVGREG